MVKHLSRTKGKLHLVGLIGQGTVHSSTDHLYALLFFCRENKLDNVFIHAITDGRDSPPRSATEVIKRLEEKLASYKTYKIASVMGRYFAMDRDRRWERTEKAYLCLTQGGSSYASSVLQAIESNYAKGKSDEFIEPTNIVSENRPIALVEKGDAIIFFNYRIDRPRQLTKAFVLENFEAEANKSFSFDPYSVKYHKTHLIKEQVLTTPFQRGRKIEDLLFVTLTEYEKNLPVLTAFPPIKVNMPLGRVFSERAINQLRISESEKERFVTYYFNGQIEPPFSYEDRLIIPSPRVPTYDLKPEMAVNEITETVISKLNEQTHKFILVNIANPDMVGHTGNIEATILAIKAVDRSLGKIVQEALTNDYTLIITADHGNAEQKINPQTGGISTEHTSNQVPFIVISDEFQGKASRLESGILADVAPTVLSLMGIPKPDEMTGRNLLEEVNAA